MFYRSLSSMTSSESPATRDEFSTRRDCALLSDCQYALPEATRNDRATAWRRLDAAAEFPA